MEGIPQWKDSVEGIPSWKESLTGRIYGCTFLLAPGLFIHTCCLKGAVDEWLKRLDYGAESRW